MREYRVALFGHRDFYDHKRVEEKLLSILKHLAREKECMEFYIGRNGEFDIFAASVIKRAQKLLDWADFRLTLVIPYTLHKLEFYEKYYDNIILPEGVEYAHPKGKITLRNKWMVAEADLIICYVEHKFGGAYKALKYAKRLGKEIMNLAL